MRNYSPKRQSVAPLHTLSKLYDVPVGFKPLPYFKAVYFFIYGRRCDGGCCSILDDLSCSYHGKYFFYSTTVALAKFYERSDRKWTRCRLSERTYSYNPCAHAIFPDIHVFQYSALYCRRNMSSWTPARSILLSHLLDDVVGTEEIVQIRQDYCRIRDFLISYENATNNFITYYTGSKAEGLNLPGSDDDFMHDINNKDDIQVIQSVQEAESLQDKDVFVMTTENVSPCFALLRSVRHIRNNVLFNACRYIDNTLYLSSDLYVHNWELENSKSVAGITSRQGPAIEAWLPYMDPSESGTDIVLSIHCPFWPDAAKEWRIRLRKFGWPSPNDLKTIVDFGFHLVPVGHPHSTRNIMEWRMSFSVAERTLAWSFNHVQMQCYAVMKLILKEFINPHCSPSSRVLCSYFIKTLIFWVCEETDLSHWGKERFRECVIHLLRKLHECVRNKYLRHYFIPSFNLLSVKMTDQAQTELLGIFDIVLKSDIRIIEECKTLNNVWCQYLRRNTYTIEAAKLSMRNDMYLKNDECTMNAIVKIQQIVLKLHTCGCFDLITLINNHFVYKTPMEEFVMKISLTYASLFLDGAPVQNVRNRTKYRKHRLLRSNLFGIDISTCRLWYAMLITKSGNCHLSARVVNNVLLRVSPYTIYYSGYSLSHIGTERKLRYITNFFGRDTPVTERARGAWMFDLQIMFEDIEKVPLAIQFELKYCDEDYGVVLSPFVCAYYLLFLNFRGLRQYNNRDLALRLLIEVVNNPEQCGYYSWHSFNIAGYCLRVIGEVQQARDMFLRSHAFTLPYPAFHRYNSAQHYLKLL